MTSSVEAPDGFAGAFCVFTSLVAFAWALYNYNGVATVKIPSGGRGGGRDDGEPTESTKLSQEELKDGAVRDQDKIYRNLKKIYILVSEGANDFLFAEYKIIAYFVVGFGLLVLILVGSADECGTEQMVDPDGTVCSYGSDGRYADNCVWETTKGSCWERGALSALAFVVGAGTSVVSGYIGMKIAVYANARTALECQDLKKEGSGWARGFRCAFRAGTVMGFSLCGLALLVLYLLIRFVNIFLPYDGSAHGSCSYLFEAIAGYGLGGSSIAMFGRVGGGIYTKAADVGADLVGKVDYKMNEDDARNCATIADNVGDNVGDIAGMGADLFGSFAEATCAALVVASVSPELSSSWTAMLFPLYISGAGILACLVTTLFALFGSFPLDRTKSKNDWGTATVFGTLKNQLWISTILMTPLLALIAYYTLPTDDFCVKVDQGNGCLQYATWFKCFICAAAGLWGGLIIGIYTEYMTSYEHYPTQEVAMSTTTGAATNIIFGLALGYKSCIVPIFVLGIGIYASFTLADMYGVALTALGMLSTLSVGLSIDAYGPITDNAGGMAEMSGMDESVRQKTDVLDAAGNTTAAIGKGFAIGSAALVSLALFGAFVTRSRITGVDILQPITFAGLLIGAMLPYWFTAMTMKSVGIAAKAMVECVKDTLDKHKKNIFVTKKNPETGELEVQYDEDDGTALFLDPDHADYIPPERLGNGDFYSKPVKIATEKSLSEMVAPGALVMLSPIVTGYFFGVHAVTGLLAGGMTSGVQMAISQSNTGGAWDNAKKWVEKGKLTEYMYKYEDKNARSSNKYGKGSNCHEAAVIGDTVGDPLKDTSGPALNILMKLMAIVSLVFAPFFASHSVCGSIGTC
eukprot:g3997.t1